MVVGVLALWVVVVNPRGPMPPPIEADLPIDAPVFEPPIDVAVLEPPIDAPVLEPPMLEPPVDDDKLELTGGSVGLVPLADTQWLVDNIDTVTNMATACRSSAVQGSRALGTIARVPDRDCMTVES